MGLFEGFQHDRVPRRALLFMPFAFAGLVAVSSKIRVFARRAPDKAELGIPADRPHTVTVVEFDDHGQRLRKITLAAVVHTEAEWRRLLPSDVFAVARRKGTEFAYSGRYWNNHDAGLYRCACCGNALFGSNTKFDSGTGWPSFWAPIAEENVRTASDVSLLIERTEVLCALCGGHLGHVFDDGPEPTGLRYCMNSAALRFLPA